MLSLVLVVFAFVLFILAGFARIEPDSPLRSRLACFGLACLAGAEIIVRAAAAKLF